MRLPDVIADFARTTPTTVRRAAAPTYVDGILTPGAASTVIIPVGGIAVQPITGRDLLEMPEGHHVSEVQVAFSEVELRSQSATSAADIVELDGEDWRVVEVSPWTYDGDTHYRSMLSRRPAS